MNNTWFDAVAETVPADGCGSPAVHSPPYRPSVPAAARRLPIYDLGFEIWRRRMTELDGEE
jgi:hypothetical protein